MKRIAERRGLGRFMKLTETQGAYARAPARRLPDGRVGRPRRDRPRGAVFGYEGLYCIDSSIIPTSLGVNPSLTIAAVAERCAERLVARGRRPRPARARPASRTGIPRGDRRRARRAGAAAQGEGEAEAQGQAEEAPGAAGRRTARFDERRRFGCRGVERGHRRGCPAVCADGRADGDGAGRAAARRRGVRRRHLARRRVRRPVRAHDGDARRRARRRPERTPRVKHSRPTGCSRGSQARAIVVQGAGRQARSRSSRTTSTSRRTCSGGAPRRSSSRGRLRASAGAT